MSWGGVLGVTLAVVLVAAGAGVGVVSWHSATKLVHPARDMGSAVPSMQHEDVRLRTADGIDLAAWWIPAPGARGTVVFLHGYGDSKDQAVPFLPFLREAGYHVLALDLRAHGASGGTQTTVGLIEVADVEAALAYAKLRDARAYERVALFGLSMGAATALNAAPDVDVDAIVADSAFASLSNVASNSITAFTGLPKYPFGPLSVEFAGWMAGADVSQNAPALAIREATEPVLVVQGMDDTIAYPHEDGEAIFAAAPPGSEIWLVPGAAHVMAHAVAKEEYEARVLAFLEGHLR